MPRPGRKHPIGGVRDGFGRAAMVAVASRPRRAPLPLRGHHFPVSTSEPLALLDADDAEHLAGLEALTDSAIAQLDVDALLGELLSRLRDALEADTAAVL